MKTRAVSATGYPREFLKFFVLDVLAAVVVGLVAWLVTGDSVSSLIISLTISILFFIVDLRFQLLTVRDQIVSAIGVRAETVQDPCLAATIHQIAEDYSTLVESTDRLFLDRAQQLLYECADEITHLREGHMDVRRQEIYPSIISCWERAKRSVFATSYVKTDDFWFGGQGPEILHENQKAADRGVKITRVFMVDKAENVAQSVKDLMTEQSKKGIEVNIAFVEDLPSDLLHDMAIFDEKYVEYLDLIQGASGMRGATFYRTESSLRRALEIKGQILLRSRGLSEWLKLAEKVG